MSKIEIKQRKKMVVTFLSFCILIFLIGGYMLFSMEEYKNDTTKQISFFIGVVIFIGFTYSSVIKLVKNQPIITIDNNAIVLNEKQSIIIQKEEIEHTDVTYVNEIGYYLNIKTKDTTHEINISWLDKTPDEIRELTKAFGK